MTAFIVFCLIIGIAILFVAFGHCSTWANG
jgi:hypothetical protein